MPLHRYTCAACKGEREHLERSGSASPECCGVAMTRAMPRRVVGRVVPDSNGVHAGSGFARSRSPAGPWSGERVEVCGETYDVGSGSAPGMMPTTEPVRPVIGELDEARVPAPSGGAFAKEFDECHAQDRDARWRDTAEAITATTVPLLESKGVEPAAARIQASAEAQRIIERSRGDQQRGGAPT